MKKYIVDAFVSGKFKGNPGAVCILDKNYSDEKLQLIAKEINLAETTFLLKERNNEYKLRWFTPTFEIGLCGHGTLSAAFILWNEGHINKKEKIFFNTLSGILEVRYIEDLIELTFPTKHLEEVEINKEILEALNLDNEEVRYMGRCNDNYIIEVKCEDIVIHMAPIYDKVMKLGIEGIAITAKSDKGKYDFVSRFFAPEPTMMEDPVTGSAHCILGEYWRNKLNKREFFAYQASERGGELKVIVEGEKTYIYGQAKRSLVAEGVFKSKC